MARIEKYTKDFILNKGVEFVRTYGIYKLSCRDLAKYIGCSTQPIFRNWKNIKDYKLDLKVELRKDYSTFITKYINTSDYLYTISYAYALYAKKEPNIFRALFITELAGTRTVKEVLNTPRNIPTIDAMTKQYKISSKEAEKIYRDVRFYTHGIASQLCAQTIKLTDKEIKDLIINNIRINIRGK
ncbi:MAG: TetR family transcriptional regulator [Bacilli bacterium]|nr:TetR family transcriptional regulator [Bacilli bacterium]